MVAAIVAGNPAGLGEAYDRYAVPLYAYCRSMLREPADAADVVQDTFLVAVSKLDGLRDPGKLRPWLYAVARNECLRRLRARNTTFALDEAADLPGEVADAASATEQSDLRDLVRDAIDGLNPGERDVIELSLGHGLDGDDLAATLGVSRNHAHALLSRARSQFERSLGALIVARTGRHSCPALQTILTGWDGRMTVLMRKRISRHIDRCGTCGERKRRELTPALFAVGLPLVALMPGFRDQVLRHCAGNTPAALAHQASAVGHAGQFGPTGFPGPLSPPAVTHLTSPARAWRWAARHSHAVAAGTAASATAAGVIAVVVIGTAHHHGPSSAGPGGGVGPAAVGASSSPGSRRSGGGIGLAPSASGVVAAPGPLTTPTALTGPDPTGSAGATVAPAGTSGTGTTSSPGSVSQAPASSPATSSSSNGAGEGVLTISPTTVTLVASGGTATGTFTLTASGGPIQHFQITVRSAHELSVSPSSGSLAAGASVVITVTANSPGPISTWIIVNPGGNKVTVQLG